MQPLIFLILFIIWLISVLKKRTQWEEKIPEFPEEPPSPVNPRENQRDEPMAEGVAYSEEPEKAVEEPAPRALTYEKRIEKLRKRYKAQPEQRRQQTPQSETISAAAKAVPEKKQKKTAFSTAQPYKVIVAKKEAIYVQSSARDGILWSIILGPPRSKQPFNWHFSPYKR